MGLSRSIGKAPNGSLVLQLAAFQMCSLAEGIFGIDRNLASKGLEQGLGWVRIVDQLSCVLMKYGR